MSTFTFSKEAREKGNNNKRRARGNDPAPLAELAQEGFLRLVLSDFSDHKSRISLDYVKFWQHLETATTES